MLIFKITKKDRTPLRDPFLPNYNENPARFTTTRELSS